MRFKRVLLFLLTAVLLLPLLSSCASMRFVRSGIYELHGKTYLLAPSCYEPRAYLESDRVGVLRRKHMDTLKLYAVENTEDERWICDKDLSMLFYAEGEKLPTLAELHPTSMHVQMSDVLSLGIGTVEDAAEIAKVVAACTTGPYCLREELGDRYDRYELKFASDAYPAFYYTLAYFRYESEVLIYEAVEDPQNFTPSYVGVEVTTEDYTYTTQENGVTVTKVEHLAVYHFGRDILYDVESGRCYMAGSEILGSIVDSAT